MKPAKLLISNADTNQVRTHGGRLEGQVFWACHKKMRTEHVTYKMYGTVEECAHLSSSRLDYIDFA